MEVNSSHWLVEIGIRETSQSFIPEGTNTVSFEEVIDVGSKEEAMRAGYKQFIGRCHYEPVMRRKLKTWGILASDCRAADAVEV